jgi:hypothetical protein
MANPDSEYTVLPAVGVNRTISSELKLSMMVPRPQIIYRQNQFWMFHAGANLEGSTFRTSETFGNEQNEPRYNNALASYRDIRVGAGIEVQVTQRLTLEIEGG